MQQYTLEDFNHMAGEYEPVAGSEGENGETILEFKGTQTISYLIEFPEDYTYGGASTRPVGLTLRQGVGERPNFKRMSIRVPKNKADEIYEQLQAGGIFRFPEGMRGGSYVMSTPDGIRGGAQKGKKSRKTRKTGRKSRKGTRRH
jgi:hypothetical protein